MGMGVGAMNVYNLIRQNLKNHLLRKCNKLWLNSAQLMDVDSDESGYINK